MGNGQGIRIAVSQTLSQHAICVQPEALQLPHYCRIIVVTQLREANSLDFFGVINLIISNRLFASMSNVLLA